MVRLASLGKAGSEVKAAQHPIWVPAYNLRNARIEIELNRD